MYGCCYESQQYYNGYSGRTFNYSTILVLFILLVIIGCICYQH